MRRILAFLVVTVDGYQGPNGEFDWPVVDEEFNEFGLEQLDEVDTLLFGLVNTRPFRSGSVLLSHRPAAP